MSALIGRFDRQALAASRLETVPEYRLLKEAENRRRNQLLLGRLPIETLKENRFRLRAMTVDFDPSLISWRSFLSAHKTPFFTGATNSPGRTIRPDRPDGGQPP